ncbi:hypothetical protein HQ308_20000 [Rhodococcus sp. BP-241]|uniref:hypothetical protein n=1 Tax=Rhodococcus sp. BP-241 TaxID=2739441 RepID=UPI001C9BB1B9|nr:hypothetical protein [Rhodococcus sp. BP-241]MBY6709076.1 hypothetical protein [Rhodococcus sp. BP-241]
MARCCHRVPRSCDFLDVTGQDTAHGSEVGHFLVWLIDDSGAVVVRAAATLPAAVDAARAYCAAWGANVHYIENREGVIVPREQWKSLFTTADPLPYVYTVELRSPPSTGPDELITALWTSTDLARAVRWRASLPESLRRRTLIVSNAPDGHHPHKPPAREQPRRPGIAGDRGRRHPRPAPPHGRRLVLIFGLIPWLKRPSSMAR